MLLKAVDIQGFKSFPDATHLTFHKGFTAVVGPNGSGKSNISDAIRWVLGEQSSKALRGNKMEDVIFVGSKTRKAQGYAQVSLIFDNRDRTVDVAEDEVVIARKYYRSGESEYLLNGKAVLYKDVASLLMDTGLGRDGYFMIGQGKIDEIVSAKSADRRQIFEEAAGISKYRYRKREAVKRLAEAEKNLLRLRDILGELQARVGPLKEQKEKAERFKSLDRKKEDLEISIWVEELAEATQRLREQENRWLAMTQKRRAMKEKLEECAEKSQEVQQRLLACQMQAEQSRVEKEEGVQQVSSLQQRIAVLENDIGHAEQEIQRLQQEKMGARLYRERLEKEYEAQTRGVEEMTAQLDSRKCECSAQEETVSALKAQEEEWEKKRKNLEETVHNLTIRKAALAIHLENFQQRRMERESEAESRDVRYRESREQQQRLEGEVEETEKLLQTLSEKKTALLNEKSGFTLKLENRKQKLEQLEKEQLQRNKNLEATRQRLRILEELDRNMEGFSYSVKQVLQQAKMGNLSGIDGTVASLIRLPAEYSLAIETALGGSLQHIVAADETAAKRAIWYLKEKKVGRATFLPRTVIRTNRIRAEGLEVYAGFVGVASDLVEAEDIYANIVSYLLGRTIVAESLNHATEIAKGCRHSYRVVTLDGQIIHAGGSMTGGSQGKNVGILTRRSERDLLEKRLQAEQKFLQQLQERQNGLQQQLQQLSAQVAGVDNELQLVAQDEIRVQAEQKRIQQTCMQIQEALSQFQKERLQILEEAKTLQREEEETRSSLQGLEGQHTVREQEHKDCCAELARIEQVRVSKQSALDGLRIQFAQEEKEWESRKRSLQEMAEKLEGGVSRTEDLQRAEQEKREQIAQIEKEIALIKKKIEFLEEQQTSLIQRVQQALLDRQECERQETAIRIEEKDWLAQRETLSQETARLEERKSWWQKECVRLDQRLWETYQLTAAQAKERAAALEDVGVAKRELQSVKSQIQQLGVIHLGAIEEYREVAERYAFLSEQVSDVETAKLELEKLIQRLTLTMQKMFADAFASINRAFERTFAELFSGGQAQLLLEDPENILESGIIIEVQPPGKIIKNLSSLSGGEKAFVAIAIYFAILQVRPAPFCILDEIEAALDDVNVNKFAAYLQRLCDQTQFIVITHRRGTMEEADVLYGVTMQEEGVSKLIELRVSERLQLVR